MGLGNLLLRMFTKKGKKKQNTNADNILEEWVHEPVRGKPGKTKLKKQKRPLPKGLTRKEEDVLEAVRKKAYRWDQSFTCCCFGFRFGWSAIIGLIPVLGDAIEVFISLSLVRKAKKLKNDKEVKGVKGGEGLPDELVWLMYLNIMIDFAAGFIPILGDVLDFWYRANTRNAWLLDNYLTKIGAERLRSQPVGEKDGIPSAMQYAPDGRDLEQGVSAYATPAVVPPARTPAPRAQNSPAPYRSTPPGRSLTGQRTPQDPRDRGYR